MTAPAGAQVAPIRITADLSDAPRRLYHAEIDLPVKAGPVTLTTPKWIPGNHRPTGPVEEITGVVFTATGPSGPVRLAWRRDDVDLYAFHVEVPKGVTTLHAHLDCITTARANTKMAVLEWERLMLYPAGLAVKGIAIEPSVTVPAGWGIGTALTPVATGLPAAAETGIDEQDHAPGTGLGTGTSTTKYAVTTVEQLEDSPVIAGEYFHEYALAPEIRPLHYLDVVADKAEDAELRPDAVAEVENLVRETGAMFQARHYGVYHFLLTLSDTAGNEGLEHGQSSDNGVGEDNYKDKAHQLGEADLLAHEFTHSWNGKYRRPARLYQPDFHEPEQGDLLWVYEGMTQYLGNVLAARSGLKSQAEYRDLLAMSAANLEAKPGRAWRSTEDTAISSSILRAQDPAWTNWRRGQDYYQEGELLWLDIDTLIRKTTDDTKSLNDFVRIFLGKGGTTGPLIVPYELPEIVADLNQVMPYDWNTFIHERVVGINPHADVAGIERGGYKLTFAEKPSAGEATLATVLSRRGSEIDVWYSLGLRVNGKGSKTQASLLVEGVVTDVRWASAADKAKISPGDKILGVNGRVFSGDALKAALRAGKGKAEPVHLIVQREGMIRLVEVDYHDGERYPVMVRVEGTKDYLDEITGALRAK